MRLIEEISFFTLFVGSFFIGSIVFAQTENPCVMQAPEGEDESLYVICNVCGDGVLDVDEECDDGNTNDGDGCTSQCVMEDPKPVIFGDGEAGMLLDTGPEDNGFVAPPGQQLPTELLSVGQDDTSVNAINGFDQITFPTEIQSTGAPRIASMIAARNIKQAQLAQQATLGSSLFILPNRLAPTGGTESLIALLMMLIGSVGIWMSLRRVR